MTPNQITAQIAEAAGRQFDTPFRLLVGDRIETLRSKLIRQTLQAHPLEVNAFQQSISLRMTSVEVSCDGLPCKASETVVELPDILRFNNQLFQFVGSVEGSNSFRLVEPGQYTYMRTSRFPATYFEYENNKIRVMGQVSSIRVVAVFDDTRKAALLQCAYDPKTNCDWWNQPFKANNDIIENIIVLLSREFSNKQPEPNTQTDYEQKQQ